jgi:2-polyprenyl-3-methyl-5-hydroxy-6-metoxy-1,4-benzoquinol methylase
MRPFLATGHSFFSPRFGGYWLKKLKPKLTDRIADVGCGNGQLVYELPVLGFENVHGFDPFLEKKAQVASGIHSFEHLEYPEEALALMYNQEGKGDQACFFCVKPSSKSGAASRV